MNVHDPKFETPKVTTGPLPSSKKVYSRPDTAKDLRVPVREIMLLGRRRRAERAGLRHHRPVHGSERRDQCRDRASPAPAPPG